MSTKASSAKTSQKAVNASPTKTAKSAKTATTAKIAVPEGKFKLYYFPINGRAFAARVALTAAGFDYEDIRIKFDELKELRVGKNDLPYNEKVPLGQLPVLIFPDGEQSITQSSAIARFAGKYNGLYPTDPLKALIVDEIMDACADLLQGVPQSDDKDQKKILRENYAAEKLPKYFELLCKRLEQSGGPFLLGENLSVGDLCIFAAIDSIDTGLFDYISGDVLKPYKSLLEHRDAVKTHPVVVQSKAIKTQ